MACRKQYAEADLQNAIAEYSNGAKLKLVSELFPHVPKRTITRGAKRLKEGIAKKRPGPDPVLSDQAEMDLVAWVIRMQKEGFPVSRDTILVKGNEVNRQIYSPTQSAGFLKQGWLNQFMARHPILTTRTSQVIKRVQAEATMESLTVFFLGIVETYHQAEYNS
mmetsp:Transcript_29271/g.44918  ORF Transcript_29271/g.44918 Transcript_29271/m.44918 type:complete len:164 (+) Transcript_29271:31-522(+)